MYGATDTSWSIRATKQAADGLSTAGGCSNGWVVPTRKRGKTTTARASYGPVLSRRQPTPPLGPTFWSIQGEACTRVCKAWLVSALPQVL